MPLDSKVSDRLFIDYELPEDLIAQSPVEPRDSSRLLVAHRETGRIEDHMFAELPDLLEPGDLLVVNDTRVLSARILARRTTGARVEILLLERRADSTWAALVNPLSRLQPGERLSISAEDESIEIEFEGREGTIGLVRVDDESLIDRYGHVPLPPYITATLEDPSRYQTVYAAAAGSAAAPTAGLHFTPKLLQRAIDRGLEIAALTLHVGVDTFRPILSESIEDHAMHSEWFEVSRATADAVNACRANGGRVVAVGTTSARVLETLGKRAGVSIEANTGRTSMYIYPPYEFRVVDALVTNFHLPKTTLLLLVGAFSGTHLLREAYAHAVEHRYRFYSFGDAMLIV